MPELLPVANQFFGNYILVYIHANDLEIWVAPSETSTDWSKRFGLQRRNHLSLGVMEL